MKDRILQFLKSENKTSAQLADEIGVQPSGISHILSGRNKPSLDFVVKMLEKYKFLSTEWLLFGKGTMYREPEMQKLFDESIELDTEPGTSTKPDGHQKEQKAASEGRISPDFNPEKPSLEKIVWFFDDGSFREFSPGRK
jgi:transcriptional regulator with XRE-family HTH domain